MDAAALSSATGKLFEALERLGTSKGAGLRSLGPGGTPPAELVKAFEDALNASNSAPSEVPQQQQGMSEKTLSPPDFSLEKMPDGTLRVPATNDMSFPETELEAARTPDLNVQRGTDSAPSANNGEASLQDLAGSLEKITEGQLSPAELYRLQYLVGMLKIHASAGTRISEQTAQGLESILKQQG